MACMDRSGVHDVTVTWEPPQLGSTLHTDVDKATQERKQSLVA